MTNYLLLTAFLFLLNFCHRHPELPEPEKVSLEEKWATANVFKTPESLLYDENRLTIYVSNINQFNDTMPDGDGFISRLKPNGQVDILEWVKGLNDPKGLGKKGSKLYVADLRELVEIDIDRGVILQKYPAPGALFLNDVTVDALGNVYVSDTGAGKIYRLEGGKLVTYLEGTQVTGANGLLAEKERLIVASAFTGNISLVDYQTKQVQSWASGIPNADGIARDVRNNYFISNWEGEVYYVRKTGVKEKVLDTKAAGIKAADIDFKEEGQLLLVPTFWNNRVVAYKVKYQ